MLFFVGVGMMLDWRVLVNDPLGVLTVLAIILFGKSVAVFLLVHFMGYPCTRRYQSGQHWRRSGNSALFSQARRSR